MPSPRTRLFSLRISRPPPRPLHQARPAPQQEFGTGALRLAGEEQPSVQVWLGFSAQYQGFGIGVIDLACFAVLVSGLAIAYWFRSSASKRRWQAQE